MLLPTVQARDDQGSNQAGSREYRGLLADRGHNLRIKLIAFADGFDVKQEKRKGKKIILGFWL